MCGICGILRVNGRETAPFTELIDRMTDCLAHRGPDDRGTWQDEWVALGSRRLSIIDLSAAGHMPMSNEDGSVIIVYNGETYNFAELKQKHCLVEKGHRFRSRTDTEVLVHLYEELGMEMLRELNGQFAFVIWDLREKKLHLARDRYGIKPLFYQLDDEHLRFGSEIKSILADSRVKRQPSVQALHDFLTFNYIPGQNTAFAGIYELPPAHYMTRHADGRLEKTRYWDLHFEEDPSITEETAIEEVGRLMAEAVRWRLIADVPIGVLLSGGMDSSVLVALMSQQTREPVRTYSLGFEDDSFNELPYARIVAQEFNTIHREVVVTPALVKAMLPKYLSYIDEPYGDGSAIPTYYVCEMAKDEVVVVLSGEGGDEAFAGYDTYQAQRYSSWFAKVPRWLRLGVIAPLVHQLPVSHKKLSLEFRLKRFLGGQDLPLHEAHLWWRHVLTESQKMNLYQRGAKEQLLEPSHNHFARAIGRSQAQQPLSLLQYIDSTVFLPDDLMIKNDRMSMAHSLEARVPFTDPQLTEYLARVPSRYKMARLRKKHLMRKAMEGILPPAIIDKKKVGLEMPYSRWFRGELKETLNHYLAPERLAATGLLQPAPVQKLVEDHMTGKVDNGRPLWGLLNYMMWHELYI